MSVHDFAERLAYSHEQSDQPWWETVYRQAFPDFAAMLDLRQDGWHQRAGRDRAVTLTSGRTIWIDEKARSRAYDDVLVEIWSVYPKGGKAPYAPIGGAKPGWAREPKDCDWLAYAFVPTSTCYLFPFLGVRAAFEKYRVAWLDMATREAGGFRFASSPNRTYDTISIAVPISVLRAAIADAMTVTWSAAAGPPDPRCAADWPTIVGGAA